MLGVGEELVRFGQIENVALVRFVSRFRWSYSKLVTWPSGSAVPRKRPSASSLTEASPFNRVSVILLPAAS